MDAWAAAPAGFRRMDRALAFMESASAAWFIGADGIAGAAFAGRIRLSLADGDCRHHGHPNARAVKRMANRSGNLGHRPSVPVGDAS